MGRGERGGERGRGTGEGIRVRGQGDVSTYSFQRGNDLFGDVVDCMHPQTRAAD